MPQLHLSVDEETARELAERAKARGQSLSRYLAETLSRDVGEAWPDGYVEAVIGSCAGLSLEEPPDEPADEVDL